MLELTSLSTCREQGVEHIMVLESYVVQSILPCNIWTWRGVDVHINELKEQTIQNYDELLNFDFTSENSPCMIASV